MNTHSPGRILTMILVLLAILDQSVAAQEPVVDPASELEVISTEFGLCDGPSWDGRWSLVIPDVKLQKLYRYVPARKEMQSFVPAGRISATFYNGGKLYLADNGRSRISWLDGKNAQVVKQEDIDARPARRPNDLVVDADGNVYFTLTGPGQVIHVAPDGRSRVALDGVETPNGIALSPDARTLYIAAYVPKKILACEIRSPGVLGPVSEFAAMDDGPARGADGMTIDRAGNVYCAGATDVWIWSPSGKLIQKINTPTRPINCTFGDADMRSLYITAFGGLYRQRMLISGKSPEPPRDSTRQPNQPTRPSTEIPDSVSAHIDIPFATYGTRTVLMDVFSPADAKGPLPTIVVVHGGGWRNGDKTKFRALAVALAARGYTTAAIEYRLADEAPFPAAIHDCHAAVRFLRANAERFHVDSERIGAVGGSAGGHLVGLMATGGRDEKLFGEGGHADQSSVIQAAIVMAGPMEMTTGSVAERSREAPQKSNANRWLRATIDEAPELYALADAHRHIDAKSAPILFMVGELDQPQRNQLSRKKLEAAGVWTGLKVYPDGKHGCWNRLPYFTDMVADMDKFFAQHLSGKN